MFSAADLPGMRRRSWAKNGPDPKFAIVLAHGIRYLTAYGACDYTAVWVPSGARCNGPVV